MAEPRWAEQLAGLEWSAWPQFLDRHSGLPGPRANLELAAAVAVRADDALVDELANSADEYRAMCGAVALGLRAAEPAAEARARELASDARWRVRMGVELGLQLLGDASPAVMRSIVLDWVADPDPLVKRAAVAAICEPRLLRAAEYAAVAIAVCRRATDDLAALPAERRREPGTRTLRQALGYCWSVAVAADPVPGLAAFRALDASDPDVVWLVKENLGKKRLATLL
jgi:hypothetical protein